jgi:pimeloyl-ACP methyl ester carboxylesterase
MRFDFSGIGDSAVRRDNLQFEKSAVTEAREAMDFLAETRGVDHFVLLGGCSGAKIALDTACCDARVIGVLLINFPSTKDEDPAANPEVIHRGASFYYRKYALFNFTSWCRLITGKANYGKLCRALWFEIKRRLAVRENISVQAQQFQASLRRLANRGVQATFLCSEGDPRLEDLRVAGGKELRRLWSEHKIALEIIRRSDHTFSSLQDQNQLMSVLLKRADAMVPNKKDPPNEYGAITDTSNALLQQLQS